MQPSRPESGDLSVQPAPSKAARMLAITYTLFVLGFVLHVAWHALFEHYAVPNKDDWRILDDMFSKPPLEFILTDQNGHHIPLTLALFWVDYVAFGGRMHLVVAASVLSFAIGLVALSVLLRPWRSPRDPLTLATTGFLGFLLAWGMERHDLVWGLQGSVIFAATWTLVALASFSAWLYRRRARGASRRLHLLALSVFSAFAATFSQGIGISSWAGLLVLAVAARLPRVAGLFTAGALGSLWIYRTGLSRSIGTPSMRGYGRIALTEPVHMLERTFTFVGSPLADVLATSGLGLGRPRDELASLCGAVGVAAFVLTTGWVASTAGALTRRHVLAIGLPTVALAGGFIVALNRQGFPNAVGHIRFATWSSLFWIGLMAGVPPQTSGRRGAWAGLGGVVALVLLTALVLPALGAARAKQADRSDRLAVLRTMHLLDIRWDRAAGGGTIVKSPERSYRLVERFERDGRSFFGAPAARLPLARLFDQAERAPEGRCDGDVTYARRIYAEHAPFLQASGWAVDRRRDAPVEEIVMIDGDGVIVGMGVPVHRTSEPLEASLPERDHPFTGFIRGNFGKGPYTVLGLLDGGTLACELGVVARRVP